LAVALDTVGEWKPARAQPAPDGLIEVRQKLTAQQDKVN
jgi:hypothetical protein